MFKYACDNKRYHTQSFFLKNKFGEKVFKASIDAGFTCPNIDGTKGFLGCTYCKDGSGEFTWKGTVSEQIFRERERISKKHPNPKLIAYFQTHTNTYASLERLRALYEEALMFQDVVGLSIATRPDSIAPDVFDCLSELAERTFLTVELGLQSIHDETAVKIRRGYEFAVFEKTFRELRRRKIRTAVHLIDGLVGEDESMMIKSAEVLGAMRPDAVKIHLLHVLKGTECEREYNAGLLHVLEKDEYVNIVTEQLRRFAPECVIERLTGDGARESLVAPMWSRAKIAVLAAIDKRMTEKDIYQGDLFGVCSQ